MSSEHIKVKLPEITKEHIDQTIRTFGWVQSTRSAGKIGTFVDLYFGFAVAKCLFPPNTKITPHSSVEIVGKIMPNHTKDNHAFEVHVISYEVYAVAPSFPVNESSSAHTLLEQGHLALQLKNRIEFLKCRSELLRIFRDHYFGKSYVEVTPPTLVQTQVEGGSTLFHLKYYDEDAYLTQSSQLYLETVVPSCMKAFCVMPSYRAEKFNTSRHLSEYTHIEGELADCTFDELLCEIEDLVRQTLVMFNERIKDVDIVKPDIVKDPFKRISYRDAIELLKLNSVMKDKELNTPYVYGDDISDRDEVKLIEILGGKPVFLVHFPVEHKPFYCLKSSKDITSDELCEGITDSVDLLWPGVGEILGGSMRAEKHDELIEAFKREGIDPAKYYWYTDLRLYGASKHGGYGLGFERFFGALMKYDSVNKSCLYPRFPGRCYP